MLRFCSGRSAPAALLGWHRAAHGAGQHSIGDDVHQFAVQPDGDSPADQRRSDRQEVAGQVDRAVAVDHPLHLHWAGSGQPRRHGCHWWRPRRLGGHRWRLRGLRLATDPVLTIRLDEEHEPFVQPRTNGKEVKGTNCATSAATAELRPRNSRASTEAEPSGI
jgi:hypothetical protein